MRAAALAGVICALAGCATFEDPAIVLDLRIIAVRAKTYVPGEISDPMKEAIMPTYGPEQVIDVDLMHPDPAAILAQFQPTTIEAFVADPAAHRELRWKMTLCLLTLDERCDPDHARIELGSGMIEDPDDSPTSKRPLAILEPDQRLLTMLQEALTEDPVQALGGIEIGVVIEVDDPAQPDVFAYAAKHLRIAPRFPAGREPNQNPYINYLDGAAHGSGLTIPPCRCNDPCIDEDTDRPMFPLVHYGDTVTLFPVEPEDAREDYVSPTLTGESATLHETLTYQWLAANGSFSDETTGGGHDLLGNQSLLGTEWRAPHAAGKVSIWMIQRDERYGVNVLETCIVVSP